MKNFKYIATVCLLFSLALASCVNDNFDEPSASSLAYKPYTGTPANITINDLISKYYGAIKKDSLTCVDKGTIIEGTVVSSDANGNFYQTLVIQDATGGIQLSVAQKGLHIYYPLGQKVVVNCDSLFIGGYGSSPLLGSDYYNTTKGKHQVGRMNQSVFTSHVTPDAVANSSNIPAIHEVNSFNDLSYKDKNTLVTLKNVSFEDAPYKLFAPEAEQDGGYAVNRNINFSDGSSVVLRTSSYVNFGNMVLPGGTGDITGVMGYYNGTYQFAVRDITTDLGSSFVKYDAVKIPLFSEPFTTSLGTMTSKSVTSASTTGTFDWSYSSSYKCATISAYDKTAKKNIAVESYLVSPTIDLSSVKQAFVSFSSAIAYADLANADSNHRLLISTDYSGDPATATWTNLPFNMSPSGSGTFNFVNSGRVGIPNAFIGKKITVALCYKSTSSKASTWEVNNFMVDEGKGVLTIPLYKASLLGSDFGFTAYSVAGTETWSLKTSYGFKISGFNKVNKVNEDWAVSPEIDLAGADAPVISFDQAINYAKGGEYKSLSTFWITDNFTGDVTTTKWTQVEIANYPTGSDWTYVSSGNLAVPSAYIGKKVHVAFKYLSTTAVATTWELKNLLIK